MILVILIVIVIIFLFITMFKKENYSYPFSAHFYPSISPTEYSYQQMSGIPYILPPVGPYSLGWEKQQHVKKEYPTESEILGLLYPY